MCLPIKPFRIEREWAHVGLTCAVVQAREGMHRCGYVRVPPGHPYHGKSYDDVADVSVHGGLTFAEGEPCTHDDGVGWWFGFDCAHAGDATVDPHLDPAVMSASLRAIADIYARFPIGGEHYWSHDEVAAETQRLAEQLAALAEQQEGE